MGTIADKLTYLNGTKSAIKDSINLTNANILSTDTFRSYATKLKNGLVDIINNGIDTLYSNFPKVTAEGTKIVLNNTYEAPIKLNVVKGDTQQDSYSGQQLFDYTNTSSVTSGVIVDSEGWITVTYDNTSGTSDKFFNYFTHNLNLEPNTQYNLIAEIKNVSGNGGLYLCSSHSGTNYGQFTQNTSVQFSELSQNSVVNFVRTTKTDWAGDVGLRSYVTIWKTRVGSITFRLSAIKNTSITPSTFTYEPYVGGMASPNPDYPQDIKVVTGSQSINVNGKNLLPYPYQSGATSNNGITYTPQENGGVLVNGTATANSSFALYGTSSSTGGKELIGDYLSGGTSLVGLRAINRTGSTYTNIGNDTGDGAQINKTTYTIGYVELYVSNGTTVNNVIIYPMMLNSLSDRTYEPYSNATYTIDLGTTELCKIGDYQDTLQKSTGKNLFDKNNASIINGFLADGGTLSSAGSYKTLVFKSNTNTTYTISKLAGNVFRVAEYEEVPTIGSSWTNRTKNDNATNITYTTSSIGNYIAVTFRRDSDTLTVEQLLDSIQIELGQTATEYEPYGKVWYKKKSIGKVVLDGSESYSTGTQSGYYYFYKVRPTDSKPSTTCLSNYFNYNQSYTNYDNSIYIGNTNVIISRIKVNNSYIESDSDFQTWLNTHNTTIYYPLSTPTYGTITNTTLINQLETIKKSYEDKTYINVSGSLPMIINASALEKE